jgi:hypothetical protein
VLSLLPHSLFPRERTFEGHCLPTLLILYLLLLHSDPSVLPFGMLSKTALLKAIVSLFLLFRLHSTSCSFTQNHCLPYSICPLITAFRGPLSPTVLRPEAWSRFSLSLHPYDPFRNMLILFT